MAKGYLSNRQKDLKIGITSYTESNTVLEVTGKVGIATTNATQELHVEGNLRVTAAFYDSSNDAGTNGYILKSTTTGTDWIDPTTLTVGVASYATSSGVSTNVIGGIASVTQLSVSGVSTLGVVTVGNIFSTGIVTALTFVGNLTGTATTATNLADAANITTGTIDSARLTGTYNIDISGNAATATYASTAGIATYATSSGIATYASTAGIATYANTAGVSTNVIGGIASVTQLSVSGVSTFTGIGTFVSDLYVGGNVNIVGVLTAERLYSNIYGEFTGGGITGDSIVGTALSISGISTLGTVQISSGIVTASTGIVTYYGDGSNLTGLTGASANTYGDGTNVAQIVVDANGRITSISEVAISGGGGGATDKIEEGNTKAEVIDTGSDGRFIVETEGVERLRINSIGNVGIGTDDPSAKLEVSTGSTSLFLVNDNVTDGNIFELNKSDGNLAFSVDATTGNVAIGQTEATSKLVVDGDVFISGILTSNNLSATARFDAIGIGTDPDTNIPIQVSTGSTSLFLVNNNTSDGNIFELNKSDGDLAFAIDSVTGNVAIGQTEATSKLVVDGDVFISGILTSNNLSATARFDALGIGTDADINIPLQVSTGSTVLFSVNDNVTDGVIFGINDANSKSLFSVDADGTVLFRTSGNVGIGTTIVEPSSKLVVDGDVSATNFNTTSDARLKTNIQVIGDPLKKVLQINGVSFNWIENNKPSLGVIADNIQEILPELVTDTNPKTVNYNGLIGLLIEVVKQQQDQINSLNDRVSRLE